MAFRTFPRSAGELRTLPADIGNRSLAVDEEGTHNESEPDYCSNEYSAKRHDSSSQIYNTGNGEYELTQTDRSDELCHALERSRFMTSSCLRAPIAQHSNPKLR